MRNLLPYCSLLLFFAVSILESGCSDPSESLSPLFCQVFYGDTIPLPAEKDTFTFRSIMLGQNMERVVSSEEGFTPRHRDEFGISYEIALSNQVMLLLDYYSGREKQADGNDRLVSIVADVLLQDEVEAARLYDELETYLNMRYGLSDGSYGLQIWQGFTRFTNNMEVRLVLNENKRQIGINFIDLQTSQAMIKPESTP